MLTGMEFCASTLHVERTQNDLARPENKYQNKYLENFENSQMLTGMEFCASTLHVEVTQNDLARPGINYRNKYFENF